MWYIYIVEHYLAIKKKETLPSATAQVSIMLSEINHSEKDKIPYYFTHMWNIINKMN